MKLLLTILTFFSFQQLWSQPSDDYIKSIESLRRDGKLTAKTSVNKTFVGSLEAYYHNDSLVLISSLTDAEAAGTETLYFFRDGILKKVFIMAATFESNDAWKEYYSRHESVDRCYACHGERQCAVTDITFEDKLGVVATVNNRIKQLTKDEKEQMMSNSRKLAEELKALSKGLE